MSAGTNSKLSTFLLAVIAASIGFLLVGLLGYSSSPEILSSQEIVTSAKAEIPEPTLPPKPAGRTVTETIPEKIKTKVPQISGLKIKMQEREITVNRSVEKFVGPTTEETRRWEAQVATIRNEYDRKLRAEISQIEAEQSAAFRAFVKDMIQMAAGIFGIIFGGLGLMLNLRKERRDLAKEIQEAGLKS